MRILRSTATVLLAALALLLAVFAAPATAARPPGSSITINEPGPYHDGDALTFTVVVPKKADNLVLIFDCIRDQVTTTEQRGSVDSTYVISGNPAYCVVNVYDLVWDGKYRSYDYMVQAVLVFEVTP